MHFYMHNFKSATFWFVIRAVEMFVWIYVLLGCFAHVMIAFRFVNSIDKLKWWAVSIHITLRLFFRSPLAVEMRKTTRKTSTIFFWSFTCDTSVSCDRFSDVITWQLIKYIFEHSIKINNSAVQQLNIQYQNKAVNGQTSKNMLCETIRLNNYQHAKRAMIRNGLSLSPWRIRAVKIGHLL